MKRWSEAIIFVGVVLLVFVVSKTGDHKDNVSVEALNAELQTWKDKDSISHARIQVLEGNVDEFVYAVQSANIEIQKLQETVKANKSKLKESGSVTRFVTNTEIQTQEVLRIDTVYRGCNFSTIVSDDWFIAQINAKTTPKTDSLSLLLSLSLKNEYSVIIGRESTGLLSRPVSWAEIINYNPYSETKSLRTFSVSLPKIKRWSVGPAFFTGIGTKGFEYGIGISLQYSIFTF